MSMPLEDTAPADRYCDLIMKGGITSGVVYPGAILELAQAYRFKNIGGTSAGAIAAVVTAAAEYRRRTEGSMAGFEVLRSLPNRLGDDVGGQSTLLALFQPEPSTKRLFKVLLSMLNKKTTGGRWGSGAVGFLKAYWLFGLAGLGLAALLGAVASYFLLGEVETFGTVVLALLGVVVGVAAAVYFDITRGVVPNGFGLCKCGPTRGEAGAGTLDGAPALVPWLHDLIQDAAGRAKGDAPLTFKDLWHAPGFPPEYLKDEFAPGDPIHSINLQVFTTNLTHGRPYHLPLNDDTSRLFFLVEQLEPYFPDDVIKHLKDFSVAYEKRSASDPEPADVEPGLRELPCGELPVVVAARLSLSFPLLISALPLWAIDYDAEHDKRKTAQCWFSDGGICSNFPIHLFDSFVPKWPTFGINLGPCSRRNPDERTWLPQQHLEGRADRWNRFDEKSSPIGKLGGFVAAIVASAQNWNDATGIRMPGVRDRVAHVRLDKTEGGFNLNMPPRLIEELSKYGKAAGQKLRERFAAAQGEPFTPGWREHRWVRFNVTLAALRARLYAFKKATAGAPHASDLRHEIEQAQNTPPLAGEGELALSPAQAKALTDLLAALEQAEDAFAQANVEQDYRPLPEPSLRVRGPL